MYYSTKEKQLFIYNNSDDQLYERNKNRASWEKTYTRNNLKGLKKNICTKPTELFLIFKKKRLLHRRTILQYITINLDKNDVLKNIRTI